MERLMPHYATREGWIFYHRDHRVHRGFLGLGCWGFNHERRERHETVLPLLTTPCTEGTELAGRTTDEHG